MKYGILIKQSEYGQMLYLKYDTPVLKEGIFEGRKYDIEFELCSNFWKGKYYTNATLISIEHNPL